MNQRLSHSFKSESGNKYDELLKERLKHLLASTDKTIWEDFEILFTGTIKMIRGEDETNILEKSDMVIKQLNATTMAGKLALSRLPKFKSKDLSPIMDHILLRASNMQYHPIIGLNLTGTAISPKMMRILVNTVMDHTKYPYLKWLNFNHCGLTTKTKTRKNKNKSDEEQKDALYGLDVCTLLSVGLSRNKSLKDLFLSKNPSIDPSGLNIILNSIAKHPSLRCLRYNSNPMSMGHAKVLSTWFASNPNLPRICMEHCSITDDMFSEMVDGLSQNRILFDLTVPKNQIGDESIAAFSKNVLMNGTTNIMRLVLFDNHITVRGAKYLSEALAVNWTLEDLNLSNQVGMKFDDEAVNLLCEGLKKNESLGMLRIGNNGLSSHCCYGLGEVLKVHPNLHRLEVYNNKSIGAEGFKYLAQGLQHNSRLKILNFSETSPGKDGGKALQVGLWKQFTNTEKLIKETKVNLRECDAIKEGIAENDVEIFSDDLIDTIIFEFVGYSLLKQLDLKNCYPNLWQPGVDDLVYLKNELHKLGHDLEVLW